MQSSQMPTEKDDWGKKKASKKKRGDFVIEYRTDPKAKIAKTFPEWTKWSVFKRYATKESRDQALDTLVKKEHLYFQYRKPEDEK